MSGKQKLGILLAAPVASQSSKTAVRLAETALAKKMDVYLYLIDDGVYNLDNQQLLDLKKHGMKLFACAYGAQQRGLPISDKATFSGLVVLSDIINGCDRFISFN
jgi:sulfur relay (sulfurtransferase) complex TusBCD TusD component (DsrE family)